MSATTDSKQRSATIRPEGVTSLRTTNVDIAASWLMSLLIVLGLIVFLLFMLFLTRTFTWTPGDIKIEESIAGRGDHAAGFERDIEPPGSEEVQEFVEPTLQESWQALTTTATSVAAAIDSIDSSSMLATVGHGRGDSRPPGPLGEGDDIIPRFERWELKFAAKNLATYSSQLDFYKIELGCIGGGIATVDYASGFTTKPRTKSGKSDSEKRLYFMWRQEGPLVAYDRQLLTQAGVKIQSRQLLKFIPPELENRLAVIELQHAAKNGHNSVKEIAKTVFESQPASAGGYQFVVIEQRYRKV